MAKSIPLPSQTRLKQLFEYDSNTGIFTRRKSCGRSKAGKPIKAFDNKGYLLLGVDGKKYKAHRIAWMYVYGEDPGELEIEHKSRNRSDNSIANLRKATRSQNNANKCTKGFRKTVNGSYAAFIRVNGTQKSLGTFKCPLLARLAYVDAAKLYFGEFAGC